MKTDDGIYFMNVLKEDPGYKYKIWSVVSSPPGITPI